MKAGTRRDRAERAWESQMATVQLLPDEGTHAAGTLVGGASRGIVCSHEEEWWALHTTAQKVLQNGRTENHEAHHGMCVGFPFVRAGRALG